MHKMRTKQLIIAWCKSKNYQMYIVLFFSCIFSFLRRTNATKPIVYNAALLGCTWDDLIKKSRRASWTFPYPTFGIRGMTSIESLYWILVLLLEWLPSLLCDIIFGLCGRKQRYGHEIYYEIYHKVSHKFILT